MKKLTVLLCLLSVLCLLAPAVLAAPGDAYLFTEAQRKELDIRMYDTPTMAVAGSTIYTLWGSDIYAYEIGSTEPTKVASDIPFAYYDSWESAYDDMGDEANGMIKALVSSDSTVYGLNTLNGKLFPLTFADGKAVLGTPIELDWSAVTELQDNSDSYGYSITGLKISGGALYALLRSYQNYDEITLVSFSLTTGEETTYPIENIQDYTFYQDGKLLVVLYDYENAYDSDTNTMAQPTLAVFDPADGSVTEVGSLGSYNSTALVYSPDSDTLYYTDSSRIMAMPSLGEPVQVAYIPVDYLSDASTCMLPGGLYAVLTWSGLIVRNVDPQYLPSGALSIYGGYIDEAATAFITDYPDYPLTFNNDVYFSTSSALAQAMASGDNAFDLYNISLSYLDFASLIDKGYCMNLSQFTQLSSDLDQIYPFLQAAVAKDGAYYAVPYNMYAYGLSILPDAWENNGLTDRIPTSFMDLVAFMQWWVDEGMDDYPDVQLMQDVYDYGDFLFNTAMDLYIAKYQAEGKDLTLDTPLFREMMEAIESVDIEALNDTLPEMDDDGNYYLDADADGYLFTLYGDWLSVYAGQNYGESLVLPIENGGEAHIPVYLQILFVNPNTKNPDIAATYLQYTLEHMQDTQHIMIFPNDNEPVVNDYYQDMVEDYETMLAQAQEDLKTAAPENVKDLEASIATYEDILSHKENYYWQASEESIAAYRKLTPLCYAASPNILNYSSNEDGSSEINSLISRYRQGQITLDQFITQADQKIRMIQLEMQ